MVFRDLVSMFQELGPHLRINVLPPEKLLSLAGWLAGWMAGWAGWAGFSWILIDFDVFSGICCHNALGLGTPPKNQAAAPIQSFVPSLLFGWLAGLASDRFL